MSAAATWLGFDLAKVTFEGDAETLAQTKISQPAIFAVSMAAYSVVSQMCEPSAVAGHSLGEYAALTAAGAFSLEDGFRMIAARGIAMQRAADKNPGSMYAILGSDERTIARVCKETPGYVLPVNYNNATQTVIAGENAAAEAAANALAEMGYKAKKLAVSSAFHSKLMASAAQEFSEAIADVAFHPLAIPFYSNITGRRIHPGRRPAPVPHPAPRLPRALPRGGLRHGGRRRRHVHRARPQQGAHLPHQARLQAGQRLQHREAQRGRKAARNPVIPDN